MKRALSLLLSAALLLALLSACRESAAELGSPSETPAALDVVNAVFPSCGFDSISADVEYLTADDDGNEFLTAYLVNAYGLAEGQWEDAAVIRATGASAFELAVLRMKDENAAVQAASSFMSYIFARQGDFAGYAPAEADMAANGSVSQKGPYAALFICPDTASADAAFEAAVSGKPLPVQSGPAEAVTDVKELRDLLVSLALREMDDPELETLDDGDPEALAAYVGDVYGLERGQWEECAIARGLGDSAFEVAVVRVTGANGSWSDAAWDVVDSLNAYLDLREMKFEGPADQAELLYRALAVFSEPYVVLLACRDVEQAAQNFADATGSGGYSYSGRHPVWGDEDPDYPGRSVFIQPNEDDMSLYDTAAIRDAWKNGDPSGLSDYDKDIYDAAQKVLGKILKQDMSDLNKEATIYNWVVNNVDYDWTHQNIMKETPRESFTPYGGLVNRTAVCLGYATTFQLLCDLAGVECITVVGAAFGSQEDHAWNMVRLDGNWYCADVTWDANYREQGVSRGREKDWDYFNVTSSDMADSDHQWDYANTPEAVTAGNGRG